MYQQQPSVGGSLVSLFSHLCSSLLTMEATSETTEIEEGVEKTKRMEGFLEDFMFEVCALLTIHMLVAQHFCN